MLRKTFQFIKYMAGGLSGFFLQLLITVIATEVFSWWHMVSYAIALAVSIPYQYVYHVLITFKTKFCKYNFMHYSVVYLYMAGTAWLAVYALTHVLHTNYIVSIICTTMCTSLLTFFLNKAWVFNKTK